MSHLFVLVDHSGVLFCFSARGTFVQLTSGLVHKQYLARVRGRFPPGKVMRKEPLFRLLLQAWIMPTQWSDRSHCNRNFPHEGFCNVFAT